MLRCRAVLLYKMTNINWTHTLDTHCTFLNLSIDIYFQCMLKQYNVQNALHKNTALRFLNQLFNQYIQIIYIYVNLGNYI